MHLKQWTPNIITVFLAGLLAALLVITQQVWAGPLVGRLTATTTASSKSTINYQGYLTDAGGTPVNDTLDMVFRLYGVDAGGEVLWAENHNGVPVTDGLFSVLLGGSMSDPNPIPPSLFAENDSLWLGISVGGDEEMTPREQLASAPSAMTVPDGGITTEKIADGAVTSAKLNLDADIDVRGNRLINIHGLEYSTSPHNGLSLAATGDSDGIRMISGKGVDMWIDSNNNSDSAAFRVHRDATCHCPGKQNIFTLSESGDLWALGTKSAVVQAGQFGQRKLYAAESPEVRFFDEGLAHLKAGVARVTLDPVFLETIEGDFLVHVTPYSDATLSVAEIGPDYFVVKAREGDPDVAFAWRLSAHRRGYAGVRLEVVENTDFSDERITGSGDDN